MTISNLPDAVVTTAAPKLQSSRRVKAPSAAQYHVVVLVGAVAIVAASFWFRLDGSQQVSAPLLGPLPAMCLWRQWFGVDCPGCGLTRSFVAIAHGNFPAAWRQNPAGFLIFALVLFQIPYRAAQLRRLRRGQPAIHTSPLLVTFICWLAVASLLAQWAWRMW